MDTTAQSGYGYYYTVKATISHLAAVMVTINWCYHGYPYLTMLWVLHLRKS